MEVTSGVHRIDGVNANTYLLVGDELTLIDTGMPRSAEKILGYISKELGRKPSDLATIVLTHCHIDHAGSAYEIRRLTSAKVAVHEEDAKFVSGEKTLPSPKGILGILFKVLSPFFKLMPVQPDIRLKENDMLDRFTVIHTPGHTLGSIALYDPIVNCCSWAIYSGLTRGRLKARPSSLR